MRIALDLLLAEKEPGGMLFATHALLERLARIDFTNEYFIITSRPQDYQHLKQKARISIQPVRLRFSRAMLLQHQVCASNILQKLQPDLLHVPAFAAPIGWNGPLVITVHDLAFLNVPQHTSWYARSYWQCLLRESVLRANAIIAVSSQTRDELVACWSIDPKRIHLIHNALRDSLHAPNSTNDQKQTASPAITGRYLLHVGRIMSRKSVEVLIQAFEILAPRFTDLQLVLTGGAGYGSEGVLRYIETSPYRTRIHQPGWISDQDLRQLYIGASMLVFPSKYEGFGLPTLEAMACGTPVIASPEAASVEIAGDAIMRTDCSNAHSLAAAIEHLLTNDILRQHLSLLGRKQALAFTGTACAEKTLKVYQKAITISTFNGCG